MSTLQAPQRFAFLLVAAWSLAGAVSASGQTYGPFTVTQSWRWAFDCVEASNTCIELGDAEVRRESVYTIFVEPLADGRLTISGTVSGTTTVAGVFYGSFETCSKPFAGPVSGWGFSPSAAALDLSFSPVDADPCWVRGGVNYSAADGDRATFLSDRLASLTFDQTIRQEDAVPGYNSQLYESRTTGSLTLIRRPVLLVPGIGGTYANTSGIDLPWLLTRGRAPETMRIDPLTKIYADLVKTLKDAGYQEGVDLFIVTYDWRLPVGPNDGAIDGQIGGGLTAAGISDELYEYGVDYLGVFLKRAAEAWAARYPGEPPLDAVNVIAHSTGGLVARAYIQSSAYGRDYAPGLPLPSVEDLVMVGVPNRGASKAWNVLQDNWGVDVAYQLVLSKIVYRAYVQVMEKGREIPGPDHTITRTMLESPSQCPNGPKICFIDKYIPSARALLATYDFLDLGEGPSTINLDTQQRNSFVLDLNAGLDRLVNVGDDPNAFADLAKVTVIYGTNGGTTPVHAERLTASGGAPGAVVSFSDVVARAIIAGDYYRDIRQAGAGDGTVPIESAAGQFLSDSRVTLMPFTTGVNTTASVGHGALMHNPQVQQEILTVLGVAPGTPISTGQAAYEVEIACAATGCANLLLDPVEGFLVDGQGRRLGYTAATGPLTEIPGSFWSGDADGMGWVLGNAQGPFTLQLTGLGGDYMAHVSVLGPDGPGGIEVRGALAAGETRTVDVPVGAVVDTTNPTAVLEAPDVIVEGHPLTVEGDRSNDPGGAIRRYFWQLDALPVVETTEPTFVFTRPTYVLTPGMHVVGLRVMDNAGNLSSVDQRQVQVIADTRPTAVLSGPASVPVGADLLMSGGSSVDQVGQIVRYDWTLDRFAVVSTTESSFTFKATTYPLAAGLHDVSLVVVDDAGQSSTPDVFRVQVGDSVAPTAVVRGPASIAEGDDLPMDGSQSIDTVGRIVGYEWTLEGFAPVATAASTFTFTHAAYPLTPGRYVVQLVVVDDSGNRSAPDAWAVDVTGDTTNPTAVITVPPPIVEGDDLVLAGDRSLDVGGRIVRYEWTLDGFPVVATTDPTVTFPARDYPLAAGAHTAQLVVVDDSGNRSTPDQVQITVTARADTVELVLRVEGLDSLPARFTVRGTAWYLQMPAGVTTPQLSSTPPCANAAECLFAPRLGSTIVIDVDPGGNLLTGPFVAGWVGCDAQANGRCYVTPAGDRTVSVRVSRTRPVFAVGTTGGALFSSAAGPGVLAFAAARTSTGDLLGGGAVVAVASAQYACGAVATVERSGNRTTLVTRYGIKAPSAAGAAPISGYSCRITVTDATSRSGRDQFTIQVTAPNGAVELATAGDASWLAFLTATNVPVVW